MTTYLLYYGAIAFIAAIGMAVIQRHSTLPRRDPILEALVICGLALIWPVLFLIVMVMKIADGGEKP